MTVYNILLACIWLAFIVVWAFTAFTTKRTLNRPWLRGWWTRLLGALVIYAIVRYDVMSGRGTSYFAAMVYNPALNLLGVILAALGIALAMWARAHLGRNWGMPMSVKENPELVTTGPYAYIRNPIYSGVILAAIGSALVNWWWIILVVMSSVYFTYASLAEERIMQREFPDSYPEYKKRTKMLIPFVL